MRAKTKYLLVLGLLMVLDILPIPIVGLIGIYVILNRPAWFAQVVHKLYHEDPR